MKQEGSFSHESIKYNEEKKSIRCINFKAMHKKYEISRFIIIVISTMMT